MVALNTNENESFYKKGDIQFSVRYEGNNNNEEFPLF